MGPNKENLQLLHNLQKSPEAMAATAASSTKDGLGAAEANANPSEPPLKNTQAAQQGIVKAAALVVPPDTQQVALGQEKAVGKASKTVNEKKGKANVCARLRYCSSHQI